MIFGAFDISASSTGWAVLVDGDIRQRFSEPTWLSTLDKLNLAATTNNWRYFPEAGQSVAHGTWRLKSEYSQEGDPHKKLINNLRALHDFSPFEHTLFEKALTPEQRGGASNESNDILLELIGVLKYFHRIRARRTILGIHRAVS